MRRVAVVGGSGFIGRHAIEVFNNAAESVIGLSRGGNTAGCTAVDYTNTKSLAVALKGVNSVVHVAGLAHVSPHSLDDSENSYNFANVQLVVNVAKAALAADVERFVLLSSAGVFGSQSPPGGFSDSMEPRPYDPYSTSKLDGERRVLEILSGQMALSILRPPMVYGPNAPGSFHRLNKWVEKGLPIPVGRILARRSFIGIRNLCSALVAAEASSQAGTLPMIVADREPVSVADFARELASANGRRSRVLPVPPKLLEYGLDILGMGEEYRRIALPFELYPSRIQSILGWRAPYSLTEELRWATTLE